MITPNIENIIKSLVVKAGVMEMGEKIAWGSDTALMRQAAAALQSQAERIRELEAEIITRASYGDEQTDFAIKLAAERDALRAQLAEIENVEPVDWAISYDGVTLYTLWCEGDCALLDCEVKRHGGTTRKMPLFTRPIPAQIIGLQDVHDAVTADPTLAESNAEFDESQFKSVEDLIAHLNKLNSYRDRTLEALSKYKGAK